MNMEPDNHHQQMLTMLTENNRLLSENNAILKKQERRAKLGMIWRIVWIIIIVGLPIIAFYYLRDTIEQIFSITDPIQQGGMDIGALLEMYGITLPSN